MDFEFEFGELLKASLRETGTQLQTSLAEVTLYASERAAFLSTLVGQKGFHEAVIAERDNVALRAGIRVVQNADAHDARIVGIIQGALAIGAKALATA